MTLLETKQQIWDRVNKNEVTLLEAADKAKVRLPISDIAEANKLLAYLTKPKKRKVRTPVDPAIKQRYNEAYYKFQAENFPHWTADGHTLDADFPDTDTANGLTTMICKYLFWTGHLANRTNNMGRSIKDKSGQEKRIKSSSINGMQDIDTNLKHPKHPYGIPWKIEIKVGKDTHKQHQKEYGIRVQKTGGVYSVVKNPEDFFRQLDELLVS